MKNTKRILSGLLVLIMVMALLPISVFADEAADVTINIAQMTNGTVTADKESYKVGDTVTLTIAPNAGHFQKLYIDGQPLMLGWKAKTYSFVAQKESYDITGSFVRELEMYSGDWGRWDNHDQAHGVLTTYYPNNNDSWWTKIKGEYTSISINAKNYRNVENSYEGGPNGGWRVMLYMQLDNGNYYAFSMWIDTDKRYAYNHYGGNIDGVASTTGWGGAWCLVGEKNAEAMAALNGDGAEFKLERTDGNHIQVTVNGTVLENYEIPGVTEANKVISVGMQHNGNPGEYIDIPFKLTKPSVQVNLPSDLEHGSVTADKAAYELGDTVTLNINRENGYFQQLYINGEPLMVDWKSNTYSFVAKERVYDITGSFVRSINHSASDWGRWDDYNQGHGILSTYYPNNNDSWWMTFNGEYQSVTVGAKNYLPIANTKDNFMVYLKVTLDNGNNYSFRVYTDKGGYTAYSRAGIQNPGDASADWGKWKNLSTLDSKITADGVDFKVERTAANELTVSVDGQVVDTYTMNGITADIKIANVAVKHQGNQGKKVQVPFYLQAVNAPDAQVIIPEFANGTVTADKESYKVGDTVTLTIAPNGGYFQKLYVNGAPVILGWKTFAYSFVATEEVMEITGSFEPGASLSPSDWGRWDDHNQAHGQFTTYYPDNNDSWWMAVNGDYQAMTVLAKNYLPIAETKDNFTVNLRVIMDNGYTYNFRIFADKGGYMAYNRAGIKNGSDTSEDWSHWKNLSSIDSKITTQGVPFKVERTAANVLTLSVDGQVVDTYTMNGITADNKIASISVKHQGNKGFVIPVPYEMTERVFEFEVCSAAGSIGSYTDFAQALANCGEGQYIKLNKDVTVNATLTKDLYIDLNGFNMTGTIEAAGFKVYGMNTKTDGYVNAAGSINCGVIPEACAQITLGDNQYRYMAVQNANGSYGFYRFYMGLTKNSLAPAVTGVGYKAEFYGSEAVKGNIASFGYSLQLGGYSAVTRTKDAEQFVTGIVGKELTLRVNNWDLESYGDTELKAKAIIVLKDGTVIEGAEHTMTMKAMVESINANIGEYTVDQILAVQEMLAGHDLDWNIENIKNYNATATLYYVNEKKAVGADPFV